MVLEALGAFAVACNVLQVAEAGTRILLRAAEYKRATDGALTEQKDLHDVLQTLTTLNSDLRKSLSQADGVEKASPAKMRLIEANNECLRLGSDFINFLKQLQLKDPKKTLGSLRVSIKSFWYRDRMNAMEKAISQARDNLNAALLLYMQ